MNRVLFSIVTFIAAAASVVVASVLLSLSGLMEVNALFAYAVGALAGIESARRIYRADSDRGWPDPGRA